jgi:hypothetical protein
MDKFDLVDELIKLKVPKSQALALKTKIRGSDLMELIGYLKNNGQGVQLNKAAALLGKYDVILGGRSDVKNFLDAKYESIRSGSSLDETHGVMTPLGEAFTYAVEVSEQNRDKVLDWLDENQIEYLANSSTNYQVKCADRDQAYKAGRALSEIMGKSTVRDSREIQEGRRSTSRRVSDAKAKMATITPKDPNKDAILGRSGSGVHKAGKDPRKDDHHGRQAKHKPRFDEDTTINEGVTGMRPVNPLFRLRELAGLPMVDEEITIPEVPGTDPNGPLGAGPVADADVDGMGDDPVADPMDDMDGGMDDAGADLPGTEPTDLLPDIEDEAMPDTDLDVSSGDVPMDAGLPGAIGTDPVEDPMGGSMAADPMGEPMDAMGGAPAMDAPTQSDAMAGIEDALNSIQTGLADIRLSEYKSLIKKLQDLTNQAQMMGRDYLGEQRRLKR